ncbi:hypothetical protein ACOMHN_006356 [Nucella lapillus]
MKMMEYGLTEQRRRERLAQAGEDVSKKTVPRSSKKSHPPRLTPFWQQAASSSAAVPAHSTVAQFTSRVITHSPMNTVTGVGGRLMVVVDNVRQKGEGGRGAGEE